MVCGLPVSACASSFGSSIVLPCLKAFTTLSISWNAATPVADAAASTTSAAPIASRPQMPRRSSGNAEVALPERLRERAHELHEGLAVLRERLDRDPLVGAVVTAAYRPELHGGHAGVEEAVGVGRAVAPDRDPVLGRPAGHGGSQGAHVR